MQLKKCRTMRLIFWVLVLTFQPLHSLWGQSDFDIIELNSRRELFVDYYLIDELIGTRLVLQQPIDRGPVFYFDQSWEGAFCGYVTIIKDSTRYRAYYRGLPAVEQGKTRQEVTCYAESPDGIQWNKPALGLFEIGGSRQNNVILANVGAVTHNFCPFLDRRPGIKPSARFKALGGNHQSGLLAYVSADGIHWKKLQAEPVITSGMFDSQNVAFWSVSEKCYVCYFRTWTEGGFNGFRTVSRSTSSDFIQWSEPVQMDFGDTPWEHIYTNQTHPYFRAPHIYLATAARFVPNRQVLTAVQAREIAVNPKYYQDCSDAVLMTSRGGTIYNRTFMSSFIRPGIGAENWVSRSNYPALNVVQTGPYEMSLYVNQNYAQPTAHLRRYSLRLDGFASVRAGYEGGELRTRIFTFTGATLYLNFSTSAVGGIRVELQDQNGQSIPGFTLEASQELIGNEIERAVNWHNGAEVSQLAGQPVRLRFVLKDADLFALQFR